MNWPFVSRKRHNAIEACYEIAKHLADERFKRLQEQEKYIKLLEEALHLAVTVKQTAEPIPAITEDKEPVVTGRGSWRTTFARESSKSIPKPADSVAALEERVKEAGGKV